MNYLLILIQFILVITAITAIIAIMAINARMANTLFPDQVGSLFGRLDEGGAREVAPVRIALSSSCGIAQGWPWRRCHALRAAA